MSNISILGAGMVGRAMAIDLAKNHSVTSVDLTQKNLELLPANIRKIKADLSDQNKIHEVIADTDLVIGAVPGFMGFKTVKTVIEAKKNIVDISFFPEDGLELDAIAKKNEVIAIIDCGVAPGMDNIILGYYAERMQVENFVCLVGGLPFNRTMPFQYKAPFSPADVLEEYTRPARYVVNGKIVVKPALSEIEEIDFDEIGTLEAFNSDGLRSLVKTMNIPNMKEKTLRYPGHAKLMEQLREMGFFSQEEINVRGQIVKPIDVTSAMFFPKWKYETGEEEFTVMRVIVEGKEKGNSRHYTYDLFDRYDHQTKTSSMERTTGYTCTAAANMVLEGLYQQKGISPPEFLGKDEHCFQYILNYLKARNIVYNLRES